MPTIKEIRTSIDQMLDRWEAAATTLEQHSNTALAALADGIETQKRKTAEAVEAVKQAVAGVAEIPEAARREAGAAADRLREQLMAARAETHEAARVQQQKIEAAFTDLQGRLEQLGESAGAGVEKAALSLLLAERELELKTELALVRFAASHVDDAVAIDKSRHQVADQLASFRKALDEQRQAAVTKGTEIAASLAPLFERTKSAFLKAYEEFTKKG